MHFPPRVVIQPFPPLPPKLNSEKPNPHKQHHHRRKKPQPHPPPDARPLRHPQHPPHRALQPDARALESVVHAVRQRGAVADLVADGDRELFELADFGGEEGCRGRVVLGLEGLEDGVRVLAAGMVSGGVGKGGGGEGRRVKRGGGGWRGRGEKGRSTGS